MNNQDANVATGSMGYKEGVIRTTPLCSQTRQLKTHAKVLINLKDLNTKAKNNTAKLACKAALHRQVFFLFHGRYEVLRWCKMALENRAVHS